MLKSQATCTISQIRLHFHFKKPQTNTINTQLWYTLMKTRNRFLNSSSEWLDKTKGPTRHIKRTTQVTLTIFDGLYSKRAISLSLEQSTFASTCRESNCTFYYALYDGCPTELLSQNAETAVSFSPLQRPQVPSSSEWPVSAPPPAPAPQLGSCGETAENCPIFWSVLWWGQSL